MIVEASFHLRCCFLDVCQVMFRHNDLHLIDSSNCVSFVDDAKSIQDIFLGVCDCENANHELLEAFQRNSFTITVLLKDGLNFSIGLFLTKRVQASFEFLLVNLATLISIKFGKVVLN